MARNLRLELHAHSTYSYDGHMDFDGMMKMARRRNLQAIAITDHDTIEGALEFQKHLMRRGAYDVEIIVGEERTLLNKTHLIGLFLQKPIRSLDFQTAIKEIADQGGLCVIPHPYRQVSGVLASAEARLPDSPQIFEIFNPTCSYEENARARELVRLGWISVGGSDAHYQGQVGECVTEIPFHATIEGSVRAALAGQSTVTVRGILQASGSGGRTQLLPLYRRIQKHIPIPRRIANPCYQMLRSIQDAMRRHARPRVEIKWDSSWLATFYNLRPQ